MKKLLLALMALCFVSGAQAQEFPSKPVRLITVAPQGGALNFSTRIVAEDLSKVLGQPVVVESMPGAGGMVANKYVAKNVPADGYTLLSTPTTSLAIPVFVKDPGYDFIRDLTSIALFGEQLLVLATNAKAPFSNFNQLVAFAKTNPSKLNIGTTGFGDVQTLFLAAINQKFGITIVDVPYKGGGPILTQALLADEIQLAFQDGGAIRPHLASQAAKALAQSGSKRNSFYSDLPTFDELGVAGVDNTEFMIAGVAGSPAAATRKVAMGMEQVMATPSVRERITKLGLQVPATFLSQEAISKAMSDRYERYASIARAAGVQPR
jgi:tripartite-type tricarboxylate transporter receptor subunit TctC